MNVAIIGHSFAADHKGWPSMINVSEKNIFAEKGVGEAKVFMQWQKIKNDNWDKVIVVHSTPTAIYTPYHPVHHAKKERSNSDWIKEDIEYHKERNEEIKLVYDYLTKYSDPYYEHLVFELFLDKLLEIPNGIHVTFGEDMHKVYSDDWYKKIPNNFNKTWILNQGKINHMDSEGNKQVAEQLSKLL